MGLAIVLAGCQGFGPKEVVSQPGDINFAQAMGSIGQGFVAMKDELNKYQPPSDASTFNTGLYPCEVTVNFNISAKADSNHKLLLDLSIKPPSSPAGGEASYTNTTESGATRGNTISVTLESRACIIRDILKGQSAASSDKGTTDKPATDAGAGHAGTPAKAGGHGGAGGAGAGAGAGGKPASSPVKDMCPTGIVDCLAGQSASNGNYVFGPYNQLAPK